MRFLGILDKNTCREVGYAYRCYSLGLERHFSVLFWKIMSIGRYSAGYSIFGRIISKPTIQKSKKNTKNRFFLKFDLEIVAHSESVQSTSKTPKLSISDHISSLKSELPLKNSSRKFVIFHFLAILRISHVARSSSGMSS